LGYLLRGILEAPLIQAGGGKNIIFGGKKKKNKRRFGSLGLKLEAINHSKKTIKERSFGERSMGIGEGAHDPPSFMKKEKGLKSISWGKGQKKEGTKRGVRGGGMTDGDINFPTGGGAGSPKG